MLLSFRGNLAGAGALLINCCTLSLFVVAAAADGQSYYDVLGLTKDATTQDVKKQFRKLSIQHHPDKNAAANTEEGRAAYARMGDANEWLSDDDKRQLYELYGEWSQSTDHRRGREFAGRHTVDFFRDEPLIKNVKTEAEAQKIFGLKTKMPHLMMLYSPWLTSCMEATPVYRRVAAQLLELTGENGVQLAAVNCESKLQNFCLRYGRLRDQYSLPVVLLLDPTEGLTDRYRGVMNVQALVDYTISSAKGIRHVNILDENAFTENILQGSSSFWLVLFCTVSEPLCQELKPVLKRLAYSARTAAKVGLVNCRQQRDNEGYVELDPFCQDQGVKEVPVLMAYKRGRAAGDAGEIIPLLPEMDMQPQLAGAFAALRAMEAILRLTAADDAAITTDDDDGSQRHEDSSQEL